MSKIKLKKDWLEIRDALSLTKTEGLVSLANLIDNFQVVKRFVGLSTVINFGEEQQYLDKKNKTSVGFEIVRFYSNGQNRRISHYIMPEDANKADCKIQTLEIKGNQGTYVDFKDDSKNVTFVYEKGKVSKVVKAKKKKEEKHKSIIISK